MQRDLTKEIITCYLQRDQTKEIVFFKKIAVFSRNITNNIEELVVDNALCEEIFAKCFQLLFN